MNFNDVCNAAVMDCNPKTRKHDWSAAVMFWLLAMITCVNGKKLFESATGRTVEHKDWREMVMDSLSLWNTPCSLEKSKRGQCRSCSFFFGSVQPPRVQIWKCFRCQHICKQCDLDGSHARFCDLLKTGGVKLRHTYNKGEKIAVKLREEREGMGELICSQGLI